MGKGFKKGQRMSQNAAIDELVKQFNSLADKHNALLQHIEMRNTEYMFYFGAVAQALSQIDPEKFLVKETGKPVDIYAKYINEIAEKQEAAKVEYNIVEPTVQTETVKVGDQEVTIITDAVVPMTQEEHAEAHQKLFDETHSNEG